MLYWGPYMRPNNARLFIGAISTFCAGACLCVTTEAQNGSVKIVFENYNLLGTFASDCTKPPNGDNLYYVNRLVDPNHAQRDRMSGASKRDYVYVIDQASGLGPNEVSVGGTRRKATGRMSQSSKSGVLSLIESWLWTRL